MPRPRLIEKRDRQLNIAVTERELVAIRERADAVALRTVEYARAVLFREKAASASRAATSKLERLRLEQVKRIGNNLNQIARQLNAMQGHSPAELEDALRDLRALIAQPSPK